MVWAVFSWILGNIVSTVVVVVLVDVPSFSIYLYLVTLK